MPAKRGSARGSGGIPKDGEKKAARQRVTKEHKDSSRTPRSAAEGILTADKRSTGPAGNAQQEASTQSAIGRGQRDRQAHACRGFAASSGLGGRQAGGTRVGRPVLPSSLQVFMSGGQPIRQVRHAEQFVQGLNTIADEEWCIELLTDGEGQKRMEEILGARTFQNAIAGSAPVSEACSMSTVIVPLLKVVLKLIRQTSMARQKNKLMAIVCSDHMIFQKLLSALQSRRLADANTLWILSTFLHKAVLESPRGEKEDAEPFSSLRDHLFRLTTSLTQSSSDRQQEILNALALSEQILTGRADVVSQRTRAERDRLQAQSIARNFPLAQSASVPYDGPGSTSDEGSRHSNDLAVIADIAVVPSADELLCSRRPALPQNSPDAAHHMADKDSIGRVLDVHFRLLRHEALHPLVAAARPMVALCDRILAAVGRKGSSRLDLNKMRSTQELEECPALWCFGDVQYVEVTVNRAHGVVHEFEANDLHELRNKTARVRKLSWERRENKVLMANEMALLLRVDAGRPTVPVIPATVAEQPATTKDKDGRHRIRVRLRLVDRSEQTTRAFADPRGQYLLFDVRAGFFSFKPILEGLQRMPLEVGEMSPVLALLALSRQPLTLPTLPAYIASRATLDFREILKQNCSLADVQWAQNIPSAHLQGHRTEALVERLLPLSRLDPGQTRAFVETLQRPLAITQGPPGTGKTHLGIALVEFLRQNMLIGEGQGPLLCVCYTNHALNQFLEHIVDAFARVKMVRIGGGSCSEKLQPYLLGEQWKQLGKARQRFGVGLVNRHKQLTTELEDLTEKSKVLSQQLLTNFPTLTSVRHILEVELPNMATEFEKVAAQIRQLRERGTEIVGAHKDVLFLWLHPLQQPPPPPPRDPVVQGVHGNGRPMATSVNKFSLLLDSDSDDEAQACDVVTSASETKPSCSSGLDSSKVDVEVDPMEARLAELLRLPARADQLCPQMPLSFDSVRGLNPWKLSLPARKAIHKLLLDAHRSMCAHEYTQSIARMEELFFDLEELRQSEQGRFLKTQHIVGATVTGMSKYCNLICSAEPKILVLEEAAEVLEGQTLSLLYPNIQHVILIGDHKQLRPKVNLYELQVDSGRGYNMDRSLFERLVEDRQVPTSMLSTQYRMRPEFSRLIRSLYPHLSDAHRTTLYPPVRGLKKNLFFWDHDEPEDAFAGGEMSVLSTGSDKSKKNSHEVRMVVALCHYLMQQGYTPSRITVLTGYVGQSLALKNAFSQARVAVEISERDLEDLMRTADLPAAEVGDAMQQSEDAASEVDARAETLQLSASAIRVATIDNFQGEENDIIVISLVRSNPKHVTGFLKIANRVNVLLSRAKHGMYLVGNRNTLTARDGIWSDMLDMMEQEESVGPAIEIVCQNHPTTSAVCTRPEDFQHNARDGGCMLDCAFRLPCGHKCPQRCHPGGHDGTQCVQRCQRTPPECPHGHPCPKLCYQDCGDCTRPVPGVVLPCGHSATLPCFQSLKPARSFCRVLKTIKFPYCSHTKEVRCANAQAYEDGSKRCDDPCRSLLRCGHPCPSTCGECADGTNGPEGAVGGSGGAQPRHAPCAVLCKKRLHCGHTCDEPCHEFHQTQCGANPCTRTCTLECVHSKCNRPCGEPCTPCTEMCGWRCKHRGACELVCSAPCMRLPCNLRCDRKLPCGHQCPGVCGEDCHSYRSFCVHCADEDRLDMVVDMLEFKTLRDVDLDADPLVVFPCLQHALVVSSADAHMGLENCYEVDSATGEFVGIKSITISPEALAQKRFCPSGCSAQPQAGGSMRRYGRVLNQRRAVANQLRLAHAIRPSVEQIAQGVQELANAADGRQLRTRAQILADKTMEAIQLLDKFRVEEAHNMQRGSFEYAERSLLDPLPEQVALILVQGLHLLNLPTSVLSFRDLLSLQVTVSAAGKSAKRKSFGDFLVHRASKVVLVLHKMEALQSMMNLITALVPAALRWLERCEDDDKIQNTVDEPFRLLLLVASGQCVPEFGIRACASALSLLIALVSSPIGSRAEPHATLRRSPRNVRTIAESRTQEVLDCSLQVLRSERQSLPAWQEIGNGIVLVLSKLWGTPNATVVRSAADEVQNLVKACLESDPVHDQELCAVVREIGKRISEVNNQALSKEVLQSIVSAIGLPPSSYGYNGSGHWNTCPNGHAYVIGDCGGAMQESTCPECGASIGGGQHQLRSDNRRIADFDALARVAGARSN